MSGKRKVLDDERIRSLASRGWTAQAIADDLRAAGATVSRATVDARMRELRLGTAPSPAPAPPHEPPSSQATPLASPLAAASGGDLEGGDDLPTEADLETAAEDGASAVAETLARIIRVGQVAGANKNQAVELRALALELQARDLLRKLTPPERPDPNDQPDMVKLGAEVEKRFLRMVDMVLEK